MKKILSFLTLGATLFALDFSSEIDTKYKTDFSGSEIPISLKVTGAYSDDSTYAQFEIKGDNSTENITLNKAYVEIYKDKFIYTAGRQPISWGNAFIFNKLNSLTAVNILNPNEKISTLDGLKLRYNLEDSSRAELMVFDVNGSSDNYALRYTTLIKSSELMINYIKKDKDPTNKSSEDINDIILDVKGDLLVGLWVQFAYNLDNNKSFYLIGSDYSYSLFEKTLYVLWEGSYDDNKELLLNYFRYSYGFNDWDSLTGGLMLEEQNKILTTTFSHKLNDQTELNLSHIYTYSDKDSKLVKSGSFNYPKNSIEVQIKAVF